MKFIHDLDEDRLTVLMSSVLASLLREQLREFENSVLLHEKLLRNDMFTVSGDILSNILTRPTIEMLYVTTIFEEIKKRCPNSCELLKKRNFVALLRH